MSAPSRVISSALREAGRAVALGKLAAFESETINLGCLVQCEPSARQAVVGGLMGIAEGNSLCLIHGQRLIEALVAEGLAKGQVKAPPLVPDAPRPYRTPQSTVDAFWYVVGSDPDKLSQWLADHPRDAAHLRQLVKSKEGAR